MREKEPILVFLGAGASIDAGIPSTAALTKEVASLQVIANAPNDVVLRNGYYGPALRGDPNKPEFIAQMIMRGLQTKLEAPNFEHILAAMEDLLALAHTHRSQGVEDADISLLSPFMWLDGRYQILNEPLVLGYARGQAIRLIFDKIKACVNDNVQYIENTKQFINLLKQTYSFKGFTLNYDNVIDDMSDDWFDGFTETSETLNHIACSLFDVRNFESEFRQPDTHTLIHMHGSIRFGYKPGSVPRTAILVKYDNSGNAFNSLGWSPSDETDQGKIISATPIISGFNKVAKLNHSPTPYGYYYRAFVDTLLNSENLIVIGYGGGDQYVNTWFKEFANLWGDKKRVVYVCACGRKPETEQEQRHTKCKKFMEIFTTKEILDQTNHFGNEFTTFGNQLANITSGFPLNSTNVDKISTFLIE